MLTGKLYIDQTNAASWGLYDIKNSKFITNKQKRIFLNCALRYNPDVEKPLCKKCAAFNNPGRKNPADRNCAADNNRTLHTEKLC